MFGALTILYNAGFNGRKMDKLIPDRKDITIIACDKPISVTFFSKHQG